MSPKKRVLVRPRQDFLQKVAHSLRISVGEEHGRGKAPITQEDRLRSRVPLGVRSIGEEEIRQGVGAPDAIGFKEGPDMRRHHDASAQPVDLVSPAERFAESSEELLEGEGMPLRALLLETVRGRQSSQLAAAFQA